MSSEHWNQAQGPGPKAELKLNEGAGSMTVY